MARIRVRVRRCMCGCSTWPWEVLDCRDRLRGRFHTWREAMKYALANTEGRAE